MTPLAKLSSLIKSRQSFLCIGLDTNPERIPYAFQRYRRPSYEFNRAIIEATQDYCVSYKMNTAFYEARGEEGWRDLKDTFHAIPASHFSIADAKRGDIGNTAAQYAKAFFEYLPADSITLNPLMGMETFDPFLSYDDRMIISLALTSNKGAEDYELQELKNGKKLYEELLLSIANKISPEKAMFVIGATKGAFLKSIRKLVPDHFFLVPGVGAQGGDLATVYQNGKNADTGLLVNVSRGIIYAGADERDPMLHIANAAKSYQAQMAKLMGNEGTATSVHLEKSTSDA